MTAGQKYVLGEETEHHLAEWILVLDALLFENNCVFIYETKNVYFVWVYIKNSPLGFSSITHVN